MPLATAKIILSADAPHESCAQFLSVIAYPADKLRRDEFFLASPIWAMAQKASYESTWAKQPYRIKPLFLSQDLSRVGKINKVGFKLVMERVICANQILLPALREAHTSKKVFVDGMEAKLENIIVNRLLPLFEMGVGSWTTFKDRNWGQTMPVAPAAAALSLSLIERMGSSKNPLADLFFSLDQLKHILDTTKQLRLMSDAITRYKKVGKRSTIRFVALEGNRPEANPASGPDRA
ncbi:hypothetical protein [Bradyrhizobium yuanmingense]|uniref:hypothetical protein n=1 Tax=Bradyrhizobium yuanmingense TaxID=108015 RepID=UPI003513DCC7